MCSHRLRTCLAQGLLCLSLVSCSDPDPPLSLNPSSSYSSDPSSFFPTDPSDSSSEPTFPNIPNWPVFSLSPRPNQPTFDESNDPYPTAFAHEFTLFNTDNDTDDDSLSYKEYDEDDLFFPSLEETPSLSSASLTQHVLSLDLGYNILNTKLLTESIGRGFSSDEQEFSSDQGNI